ncbi:Copia type Polyprotein [Phytophthora cinnamomi]|uniref:Copia type Polyprotein n=1 Tax=Phytophthora cinnamomi TaxID=4785 RepID=UPI0035593EB5|nr:Copia type Polyprotein [Phytophthora cinnamomi]
MKDAESDELSSDGRRIWDAMVHNSTPFDLDAESAASDEPLLDYESDIAFKEMQEGGSVAESEYADTLTDYEVDADADDGSAEAYEIEAAGGNPNESNLAVASSPRDSDEEVEAESSADQEHDDDREAAENEVVVEPGTDEDENYRESTDHITDLVVVDTEDHGSYEQSEYDCLFDPVDENEVGHREFALAEDFVIGRRRRRGDELRESNERRRPERFGDFLVYSAFNALHADRCGTNGIRMSDVKIPRTRREALRSKYAPFWEDGREK